MTAGDGQRASLGDVLCPLLGVMRDPNARFDRPTPAHACYAGKPRPIALDHQSAYCLSGTYESCPRFIKATGLAPVAPSVELRSGSVSLSTLAAAFLALALVGVLGALAVASGLVGLPASGVPLAVVPSPTSSPAITQSPGTAAPATTAPALTSSPPDTAVPTETATASPSAAVPPVPAPTPRIHVVVGGESLTSIGNLYDIPWQLIAQANGLTDPSLIYVGQALLIPQPGDGGFGRIHYVEAGETLSDIADLYGVSSDALAEANGLEDVNTIYAGQPLIIPEP